MNMQIKIEMNSWALCWQARVRSPSTVLSKGIKWVCCKIGSIVWVRCILHFYTKSPKAQRICLCPNLVAGLVRPQWGSWERESWLGSLGDNPRCNVTVTTTFQHSATNQSGPGVSSQSEAMVHRQLQVPAASWTWRQQIEPHRDLDRGHLLSN